MKKYITLLLIILLLPSVIALDLCEDKPEINTPCIMVTPEISSCGKYEYEIFNMNGTKVNNGSLEVYNDDIYYFNLTQPSGDYVISLCDGATREITVNNDDSQMWLYILGTLVFIGLLVLGFYLEDEAFVIISGMLSIVMAINLFNEGFPELTNVFLKNGIVMVLAGIGFYFIIAPSVELLESWSGGMNKVE